MSAEQEVKVLRGEPITILIGQKEETVLRLSIDDQISVMDIISQPQEESSTKAIVERMIKIISLCMKKEVSKEEFSSAAQIVSAFNKVWMQNEFDFLLQQVGNLKLKAN